MCFTQWKQTGSFHARKSSRLASKGLGVLGFRPPAPPLSRPHRRGPGRLYWNDDIEVAEHNAVVKELERGRERDTERDRDRERQRQRETETDRQTQTQRER